MKFKKLRHYIADIQIDKRNVLPILAFLAGWIIAVGAVNIRDHRGSVSRKSTAGDKAAKVEENASVEQNTDRSIPESIADAVPKGFEYQVAREEDHVEIAKALFRQNINTLRVLSE